MKFFISWVLSYKQRLLNMPYYSWIGVDLEGNIKKGKNFSRSEEILNKFLLYKNSISPIKVKKISAFFYKIPTSVKVNIINHFAVLLSSSIHMNKACNIVSRVIKHKYSKEILIDIENAIEEGISFSKALSYHPTFFDSLSYAVITAGEQSGNLARSFLLLSEHNQVINRFKEQVRSALLVPILTFVFFIIVILSIFIFVIPQFESFFATVNEPLPKATRIIFALSNWIRYSSISHSTLLLLFLCLLLFFLRKKTKKYKDRILISFPVIGHFFILIYRSQFLQVIHILLSSGIQIVESLNIAYDTLKNFQVRQAIKELSSEIYSGKSVSQALQVNSFFSSPELQALLEVGESAGDIGKICAQASAIFQKRVYAYINRMVSLVQPILLITLGLCIAFLIFSVYMPLFTLSSIIQ